MEIPQDDVGIELMNARFLEMGILVAGPDGYDVAPEFVARIENAVRRTLPHVEVDSPPFRAAVLEELRAMAIPHGFEPIVANWVVHALRVRTWSE